MHPVVQIRSVPRAPRISGPDTLHHVVAHGVDERPLYRDDADRWAFIGHLGDVTRKARWALLAFCLMETHYHLILRERDVPLSRGMQLLNSRYARSFNERYARRGHVFDGRFRDRLIDGDGHLLMALRYVARNPVEVDACAQPADWPWGSYGQLVGAARGWSFVAVDECLAWFAADPTVARARVRDFVEGN